MNTNDQSPTPRSRAWIYIAFLLIGAVFAVLLLLVRPRSEKAPPALPTLGTVPAFALTEAGGGPITRESMKGKICIVDFIFTRCGGTCPMMTSTIYQLTQEMKGVPNVQYISVSVDPEHDRPDSLRAYADNNGLPREHWWFLTGERTAIYELARNGFHLAVMDSGNVEGLITHSDKLALVDPSGTIRGYYDGTDSTAVPAIKLAVAALEAERSGSNK